ncbi:MFS transporter [Sporomusa aerivorans]|uniref:MFS transporter n=1 Tax=Sporomusa aerivorans TaxID=204936 RepID=UPI00352A8A43
MNECDLANAEARYPAFRWLVLAAGILMMFMSMLTALAVAPLMGVIAPSLGIDIGTASFGIMGLNLFSTAISVIIVGILVDRIGIMKVMTGSLLLLLAVHLAYPVIGYTYNAVVGLRILTALGGAVGLIAINPIVSQWFPVKEKGLALGLNCLTMLGGMAGFTVGPMFAERAGSWQTGLAWLSYILVLGIIFLLYVTLNEKKHQPPSLVSVSNKEACEGTCETEESFSKVLLHCPPFWIGLAVMALSNWANNAFNDLSPSFLAIAPPLGAGYGPEVAGRLSSGAFFGSMFGIFCSGLVIDKVFKGRSGMLVAIGFICSLVFYNGILLPQIHGNMTTLSAWLLLAGFTGPFTAVGNQYFAIKNFSPHVMGKVTASWTCISNFTGAFGVMAGSYALHHTGTYVMSFGIVASICVLGLVAAAVVISKERSAKIDSAGVQA